jgi:hypothetical protein
MSVSPTLFAGSGPIGIPPVPWTEKRIERSPFFIQHGGQGWLDRQPSDFFRGFQKLEQRAKKCIELRGEYVE